MGRSKEVRGEEYKRRAGGRGELFEGEDRKEEGNQQRKEGGL